MAALAAPREGAAVSAGPGDDAEGRDLEAGARCANCGATLTGPYCAVCGQEARTLHQPLRAVIADWAGDAFAFDSRLGRTLRQLLRRPGGLTLDVWNGRRARYVPPLRLYLFVSFLFFVVVAWFDVPISQVSVNGREVNDDRALVAGAASPEEVAAIAELGWWGRLLTAALSDPEAFERRLLDHLPVALFLLVPALASLLQLLLRSARRFWLEHFVFALHVHSFGFLLLAAAAPLDHALGTDLFGVLAVLGSLAYLALAIRRAYAVRWRRTIPVTGILGALYVLAAGLTMIALLVVTLALG